MAHTVKVKRSAVQDKVPVVADLDLGEIAVNTYDGKMYIKKDDGTASIVEITASGNPFDQDLNENNSPTFVALTSTIATGTAPFTVASTTLVSNLNVKYLSGYEQGDFMRPEVFTTRTGALKFTDGVNILLGSGSDTIFNFDGTNTNLEGTEGNFNLLLSNHFYIKDRDDSDKIILDLDTGAETLSVTGNISTGGVFDGRATSANYADMAEKYSFSDDVELEEGKVVLISETDDFDCELSNEIGSDRVLGVMSLEPAFMMNSESDGEYVALKGRLPCLVQGPIKKGEPLISYINGTSIGISNLLVNHIDSTKPGIIFGKSLCKIDGDDLQMIEVVVI